MNKILINCANRGIGLELCRQLAARGDQVIAVCRGSSDGLIARMNELNMTSTGSFWHAEGERLPW